ncbi:hypothetical protein C8R44DRAFT_928558 [Mycena epipterygia]|nr:hypothetical protein C8R44DRAFT_928558 [Mycena epipterygia]
MGQAGERRNQIKRLTGCSLPRARHLLAPHTRLDPGTLLVSAVRVVVESRGGSTTRSRWAWRGRSRRRRGPHRACESQLEGIQEKSGGKTREVELWTERREERAGEIYEREGRVVGREVGVTLLVPYPIHALCPLPAAPLRVHVSLSLSRCVVLFLSAAGVLPIQEDDEEERGRITAAVLPALRLCAETLETAEATFVPVSPELKEVSAVAGTELLAAHMAMKTGLAGMVDRKRGVVAGTTRSCRLVEGSSCTTTGEWSWRRRARRSRRAGAGRGMSMAEGAGRKRERAGAQEMVRAERAPWLEANASAV